MITSPARLQLLRAQALRFSSWRSAATSISTNAPDAASTCTGTSRAVWFRDLDGNVMGVGEVIR